MTTPKARNRNGDYPIEGAIYPGVSNVIEKKRSYGLDWYISGVATAHLAKAVTEGDTDWAEAIMAGDVRAYDTAKPATIKKRGELVGLPPHKAAAYIYKRAKEDAPRDAADLGTAIHAAIEEVDAGLLAVEDIEDDDVRMSVETYVAARALHGWKVVHAEATVVSEVYGYAGTADLIIDLPGVGLVVADIKTGTDVWPDVALQLAAYSHADFIWDAEDEKRQPMPPHLRTDVGVVIHVRPEGTTLRLVNLVEAWPTFLALLRVCQWEDNHARDAIGATIAAGGEAPERLPVEPTPAAPPDGMAYTEDMPASTPEFIAALDRVDARLRHESPDDGDACDEALLEPLRAKVTDDIRPILNAWLGEAKAARRPSWSFNNKRHVRQFEATRAAIALAGIYNWVDEPAEAEARACIAAVIGDDECQTHPIGALLATLTIAEARSVARVATALGDGALPLTFADDGTPVLGDVAAFLAA